MLKKEIEYKKAYTLNRQHLEEVIEKTYNVPNFQFEVHEDDTGRYLALKPNDLLKIAQRKPLRLEPEVAKRFDLGDYAYEYIQLITGDKLRNIILRNYDQELLCLV